MTPDDPMLTAYALGEEATPADRARIEAAIANDESLRAEVDAIRGTAGQLSAALAAEPAPPLPQLKSLVIRRRTPLLHLAAASVAGLLIGGAGVFVATKTQHANELAAWVSPPVQPPLVEATSIVPFAATQPTGTPSLSLYFAGGSPRPGSATAGLPSLQLAAGQSSPSGRFASRPTLDVQLQARGPQAYGRTWVDAKDLNKSNLSTEFRYGFIPAEPGASVNIGFDADVRGEPALVAVLGDIAQPNTETYAAIYDNPFLSAFAEPLSTFSVDVDTASYANVRRFLQSGQVPPADAVRIEELVNYFPYHYAAPAADDPAPFRANVELADCPWNANAKLLRVALKGKEIAREARPPSNLVFLIDVSGSMNEPNKLPLVKQSLAKLVNQLDERDTVSIVVYAGASGMALAPTRGDQKQAILNAIHSLQPGGSTNGAAGIELAYQLAVERFLPQGTNRVMLLTDGDFNVGIADRASLVKLIEEKAKTKVYLSVLGFGTGNLKDATMEELAGKGNGNAAYIDSDREAQKVLVEQMSGTLVTIAKDVKLQVEFNPRLVKRYRLIGYENRMLQKQDFSDDKKDAGDIGAGHAVTALYEIEPTPAVSTQPSGVATSVATETREVDPLRYQTPAQLSTAASAEELGTLKLRYKPPTADAVQGTSKLIEVPIASASKSFDQASDDFRFASSVAGFGMLVRGSPHRGSLTWPAVKAMAQASLGDDAGGYRAEFLTLVEKASVTKRN